MKRNPITTRHCNSNYREWGVPRRQVDFILFNTLVKFFDGIWCHFRYEINFRYSYEVPVFLR